MKRTLLFILMIGVLLSTAVYADYSEGYFYYIIDDYGVVITGYFGNETAVVIPDHIAGYPVYAVARGTFEGKGVASVSLPDTVIEMRDSNVKTVNWAESSQVPSEEEKEQSREELGITQNGPAGTSSEGSDNAPALSEAGFEESAIGAKADDAAGTESGKTSGMDAFQAEGTDDRVFAEPEQAEENEAEEGMTAKVSERRDSGTATVIIIAAAVLILIATLLVYRKMRKADTETTEQ